MLKRKSSFKRQRFMKYTYNDAGIDSMYQKTLTTMHQNSIRCADYWHLFRCFVTWIVCRLGIIIAIIIIYIGDISTKSEKWCQHKQKSFQQWWGKYLSFFSFFQFWIAKLTLEIIIKKKTFRMCNWHQF